VFDHTELREEPWNKLMLEPIVAFFDKLIENFSWRRLSFLLAILMLAAVAMWAFEAYTSTFRLARIEKQIVLLEKLATVSVAPAITSYPHLSQIRTNLQKQLLSTTSTSDIEYELLPWGKKVLSAAAAWLVFALFLLLIPSSYSSTNAGPVAIFMGMVVVAAPFIALAAALPTFDAGWVNYLAYPIGHIVMFIVLILWWQRRSRRKLYAALGSLQRKQGAEPADA
jgi:ABC-type transport system involved in cytochrome bd biosynthesis fused ATPase/permease subunit